MNPRQWLQRPWWRFAAFGLALHAVAAVAGFMLPGDIAKSALWWLALGSALLLAAERLGPRAAGRSWLALTLLFCLDIGTQGVVRGYFGATPQPGVIAESLANTTASETTGFLLEQWRPVAKGLLLALLATAAAWRLRPAAGAADMPPSRSARIGLWVAMGLAAALHLNPAMLRTQPLIRWGVVYARHAQAEREIAQLDSARAGQWAQRAGWGLQTDLAGPRTVVLVVGESATRFNWGALGYARDTTQPLTDALPRLHGQGVIFREAWSAEAFTLPSLHLALTPAEERQPEAWQQLPDVTQLARAAGYHVSWLSNQPAHEGWFAAMARSADRQRFINKGNWRDSSATDHDLLPPLRELLAQAPPERELLVVHLLGQHFHFRQRCPESMRRWAKDEPDDAVTRQLRAAGRSAATIRARNEYDDAVRCGADVLAQMLGLVDAARPGRDLQFFYFSDHGQEVGHHRDFAGHSQVDDSGYAIPMLWWARAPAAITPLDPQSLAARPFRLDWADHAIQHLLGIRSRWYRPELDLFSPAYHPPEPAVPPALARHRGGH